MCIAGKQEPSAVCALSPVPAAGRDRAGLAVQRPHVQVLRAGVVDVLPHAEQRRVPAHLLQVAAREAIGLLGHLQQVHVAVHLWGAPAQAMDTPEPLPLLTMASHSHLQEFLPALRSLDVFGELSYSLTL